MAGIGFRLKRLVAEDTSSGWVRAHLYGAALSSGPWLASVCALAALGAVSHVVVRAPDEAVFRSIVVFSYVVTLVTTGGVQMVVTRHLADALFVGNAGALGSAYHAAIALTALVHLLIGAAFYAVTPELSIEVRVVATMLLVLVSCTWIAMIFVGAAEDYASVFLAFLLGNAVSVAAALGAGATWGLAGFLGGFVVGQAVVLFGLGVRIERELGAAPRGSAEPQRPRGARRAIHSGSAEPQRPRGARRAIHSGSAEPPRGHGGRPLAASFRRYPDLMLCGVFYAAAIGIDRVVFWFSPEGWRIAGGFRESIYDPVIVLAYVSVVPSLAVFLVRVEADFYEHYRRYYGAVVKHGTLGQVGQAKADMETSLGESLRRLLWLQAPITAGLLVIAPWVAEALEMDRIQTGILRATLIGARSTRWRASGRSCCSTSTGGAAPWRCRACCSSPTSLSRWRRSTPGRASTAPGTRWPRSAPSPGRTGDWPRRFAIWSS